MSGDVVVDSDAKRCILVSDTIRIWDVEKGELSNELIANNDSNCNIYLNDFILLEKENRIVIHKNWDNFLDYIQVWDLDHNELLYEVSLNTEYDPIITETPRFGHS